MVYFYPQHSAGGHVPWRQDRVLAFRGFFEQHLDEYSKTRAHLAIMLIAKIHDDCSPPPVTFFDADTSRWLLVKQLSFCIGLRYLPMEISKVTKVDIGAGALERQSTSELERAMDSPRQPLINGGAVSSLLAAKVLLG
jgi:hypothetical protein